MHLDLLLGPRTYARRRHAADRAAVDRYESTTRRASQHTLARVHEREWGRLTAEQRDLLLDHLLARMLGEPPPSGTTREATPSPDTPTEAEPTTSRSRRGRREGRARWRPVDPATLAALAASAFGPFSVIALPWGFLALPNPHVPHDESPDGGDNGRRGAGPGG